MRPREFTTVFLSEVRQRVTLARCLPQTDHALAWIGDPARDFMLTHLFVLQGDPDAPGERGDMDRVLTVSDYGGRVLIEAHVGALVDAYRRASFPDSGRLSSPIRRVTNGLLTFRAQEPLTVEFHGSYKKSRD